MRLIDADELKHDLEWLEGDTPVYLDVMSTIDERTTVDAVEVVRCKDCKECEERHTANYLPFLYCKLNEHSVSYNAFCCWAERREDENT